MNGSSSLLRAAGRWALRLVGPAVLAFLLIEVVDYDELGDLARDIDIAWAAAAVAAVQVTIALRTFRWIDLHDRFGLRAAGLLYQLRLTYATTLATLVLPQIVNPLSRFVLMLQDGFQPRRALVASIVEKLLDFASFVLVGLFGAIYLASVFGGLVWWAVGGVVVMVFGVTGLYLARMRLHRALVTLVPRIPGVRRVLGEPGEGDRVVHEIESVRPATIVRWVVWSVAVALSQASVFYFLSQALGLGLSYWFMTATWGVVALTMLLPLSVNGVGTREGVLILAFDAVDRSADAAVAVGLLVLAVSAVGASPGIIEWLRRFLVGGERVDEAATAAPAIQSPGDRAP